MEAIMLKNKRMALKHSEVKGLDKVIFNDIIINNYYYSSHSFFLTYLSSVNRFFNSHGNRYYLRWLFRLSLFLLILFVQFNSPLYPLLIPDYLFYEHLRSLFGVVALTQDIDRMLWFLQHDPLGL